MSLTITPTGWAIEMPVPSIHTIPTPEDIADNYLSTIQSLIDTICKTTEQKDLPPAEYYMFELLKEMLPSYEDMKLFFTALKENTKV